MESQQPLKKLIEAINGGIPADFSSEDDEKNDPVKDEQGAQWTEERIIDAKQLILLLNKYASQTNHFLKPVKIIGARIRGVLDCSYLKFPFSLCFEDCYFNNLVNFYRAYTEHLEFKSCLLQEGFNGREMQVKGSFTMTRGLIKQACNMRSARIAGDCNLSISQFKQIEDESKNWLVDAIRIVIQGDMIFNAYANGPICLDEAAIEGNLFIQNGDFRHPQQDARVFRAENMKIGQSLRVDNSKFVGEMDILYAQIKGSLLFSKSHFFVTKGNALLVSGIVVTGLTRFDETKIEGSITMIGSQLLTNLEVYKSHFENKGATVFEASHLRVNGMMRFDEDTKLEGTLSLVGCEISRSLYLYNVTIENTKGYTVDAANIHVGDILHLGYDFVSKGIVSFYSARVGGAFEVFGHLTGHEESLLALQAQEMMIEDSILLQGNIEGHIQLYGSRADVNLDCIRLQVVDLDLSGIRIAGTFFWQAEKISGHIKLRNAKVGRLEDDLKKLPHEMDLDGFEYQSLATESNLHLRKKWLAKATKKHFTPQPYEHLVKVLRASGHDEAAKSIAIAKRRAQRHAIKFSPGRWLGNILLDITIAYGYQPLRGLALIFALIIIGSIIFSTAFSLNQIFPSQMEILVSQEYTACSLDSGSHKPSLHDCIPEDYPQFQPFVYSMDVFLPIIDFHQERYWLPKEGWIRMYFWVQIALGWILSTIVAAGLSGLIKKE